MPGTAGRRGADTIRAPPSLKDEDEAGDELLGPAASGRGGFATGCGSARAAGSACSRRAGAEEPAEKRRAGVIPTDRPAAGSAPGSQSAKAARGSQAVREWSGKLIWLVPSEASSIFTTPRAPGREAIRASHDKEGCSLTHFLSKVPSTTRTRRPASSVLPTGPPAAAAAPPVRASSMLITSSSESSVLNCSGSLSAHPRNQALRSPFPGAPGGAPTPSASARSSLAFRRPTLRFESSSSR
mmetsp:Transcript_9238/g.25877  ORF Transcript_9238/g.25877 Transcript_9238/m.25877 type:complete len:241 (+) Transcript_9238:335-1057(+)